MASCLPKVVASRDFFWGTKRLRDRSLTLQEFIGANFAGERRKVRGSLSGPMASTTLEIGEMDRGTETEFGPTRRGTAIMGSGSEEAARGMEFT